MDQLLAQLSALFVGALPSAILLILLFLYLRIVLFKPLEKILADRHSKMGGREQRAAEILRTAEQKMQQYSTSLQTARTEIYASQDALRQRLETERDAAITSASGQAKAQLASVKQELEGEMAVARAEVASEAAQLAESITAKLMVGGKA